MLVATVLTCSVPIMGWIGAGWELGVQGLRRRLSLYARMGGKDNRRRPRKIIAVAREFASNAEKTNGKSMVILGAGLNHWYHMDMAYRGIINMLVMCGCIGQEGAAGRIMSARKSCVRRPAGSHWPLRWTGAARRGT
ncbi:molybdopterin-dependent oxidoreductase (plasmid) [Paracoccus marcusii]|uniref:molybdopterin-dependent oxidoreductase n=1 Tax=Paracoccus marcusii TaxID=59779 RepID=UPI002ED39124|nr:molybdopterin-dependent oxidoreductase [Paracoccus marcusii]